MQTILVTGGAGFIGSNLINELLKDSNNKIICFDNFDEFYDVNVKKRNIAPYFRNNNFTLIEGDIRNTSDLEIINEKIDVIIHLAAKAGVRPSIENPLIYQEVNVLGTQNLLEFAKQRKIKQFVFASSSSVYGVSPNVPWSESSSVLLPISPYASTKVSCELLGHVYASLYQIRFIALRFFTVYGPGQRPDLAIHKFIKSIVNGMPIPVYGDGSSLRDYTYVDDIVEGIISAINYRNTIYEVVNLGNNNPVRLIDLIGEIEKVTKQKAKLTYLPIQEGDVPVTYADTSKAKHLFNYNPKINLSIGLISFYEWYKEQINQKVL